MFGISVSHLTSSTGGRLQPLLFAGFLYRSFSLPHYQSPCINRLQYCISIADKYPAKIVWYYTYQHLTFYLYVPLTYLWGSKLYEMDNAFELKKRDPEVIHWEQDYKTLLPHIWVICMEFPFLGEISVTNKNEHKSKC